MTVKGRLDGAEGCYVTGWAIDGPGSCKIAVRSQDGKLLAEGFAGRDRADLVVLGLGRSNFAFRIAIPKMQSPTRVHVFANNVELLNSPIEMGNSRYSGEITVIQGKVDGWIAERTIYSAPPRVMIVDQDGRIVAEALTEADQFSTDPLFTPCRFLIDLDQSCFGNGELRLDAVVDGSRVASTHCDLVIKGNIEEIRSDAWSGWLFSPSAPDRNFEIEVFRNGLSMGVARCEIARGDVKALFPTSEKPGFSKSSKTQLSSILESTTLSFRFPGSERELFDGPYVIGSRPAAVIAARKIAGLALSLEPKLNQLERSVLQTAITGFLVHSRHEERFIATRQFDSFQERKSVTRVNIIIPIYRNVDVTKECIESLITHRASEQDRIILINDHSPDVGMEQMLQSFSNYPNVILVRNVINLGFIKSVNLGISLCKTGDVILLNSDTKVFRGGLKEIWDSGHSSKSIGTVTAMSNNATIFSYPHFSLTTKKLDDISWEELADIALKENQGLVVDVPTGHGFCMLIKRELLDKVERFDEHFGRGYGEENDFCARAADLGFRNVIAGGAFVEHRESISFLETKEALLHVNIPLLEARYPEYTPIIMDSKRIDTLRRARWALDAERLRRTTIGGNNLTLIIRNGLVGGSAKAIQDIERTANYNIDHRLTLTCRSDGFLELTGNSPQIFATFSSIEVIDLFLLLSAASPAIVLVHQLLGYSQEFIRHLREWISTRHSVFYAHDYYSVCPRVTMIDATERFCWAADADRCARCVGLGGTHEWSRFDSLAPVEHRQLFETLLSSFTHVVAPSQDAARYIKKIFPNLEVLAIPHPEYPTSFPASAREGTDDEIVLLGAIGPHKGSRKLQEIAQRALLTHPLLHFRVIGHTDIDEALHRLGNVTVTGEYEASELERLFSGSPGRIALFLSVWPETFSYTLSEVARYGFVPMVPDIGAMAERVRQTGFGVVFPFPIEAQTVLEWLDDIRSGKVAAWQQGAGPRSYLTSEASFAATKSVLTPKPQYHRDSPARSVRLRPKKIEVR